jgi:Gas vesicle synthesis protein GvpO
MADSTREARTRRSEARDRRRSRTETPVEEADELASDTTEQAEAAQPSGEHGGTAAKLVGTAVAAMLLGAVGGAAKALLERRDGDDTGADEDTSETVDPEATAEAEPAGQEPADEASASPSDTEDDAPESQQEIEERPQDATEAEDQAWPEDEAPEDEAPEDETKAEDERHQPIEGVSDGAANELVDRARRQLEGLLDTEPERMSGFERRNGGWAVTFEVVEVSRVPATTDILATYELVLDDDRNLVSVSRTRRYRRSQVDETS